MKISTELYLKQLPQLPREGQHIVAHQAGTQLVVYQAYKPSIARYAVEHQQLGGLEFSYGRMSWIKLNFLWMMYRCGWASKENQERVLALWLDRTAFEGILGEAAFSTFAAGGYASPAEWQHALAIKKVRLQWDPDHGPHGNKLVRRAIQLGLKGEVLERFGRQQVALIEDITDFVHQQQRHVGNRQLGELVLPAERVYQVADPALPPGCASARPSKGLGATARQPSRLRWAPFCGKLNGLRTAPMFSAGTDATTLTAA